MSKKLINWKLPIECVDGTPAKLIGVLTWPYQYDGKKYPKQKYAVERRGTYATPVDQFGYSAFSKMFLIQNKPQPRRRAK